MPPKITNLMQLRNHLLKTLDELANGQIDIHQAGVTAKLSEGVISTIKCELEFAKLTKTADNLSIDFIGKSMVISNMGLKRLTKKEK